MHNPPTQGRVHPGRCLPTAKQGGPPPAPTAETCLPRGPAHVAHLCVGILPGRNSPPAASVHALPRSMLGL
eukprot:15002238-Alexandrium_andersonii.AAC.1